MRSNIMSAGESAIVDMLYELSDVSLNARVKSLNIEIGKGQFWHFLGPNGAGKSTLMLLLAGVESATQGSVTLKRMPLHEHSLTQLASTRCFLHQQQHSEFDIPLSQLLSFYTKSSNIPSAINQYLHIAPLLSKPLSALSGGQQQRFHIARNLAQIWPAIMVGNGIVILDEPISHLDIQYQSAIMALLTYVCSLGNCVIMTSHDINISQQYASHVGLLKQGQLLFSGKSSEVLTLRNLGLVFEHEFAQISDDLHPQQYIVSAANRLKQLI